MYQQLAEVQDVLEDNNDALNREAIEAMAHLQDLERFTQFVPNIWCSPKRYEVYDLQVSNHDYLWKEFMDMSNQTHVLHMAWRYWFEFNNQADKMKNL